jgi:hypothetical protein
VPLSAAVADTAISAEVLSWINALRSPLGLTSLAADPTLERTAETYAADLARRGILSHVDEQGRRALQRVQAEGGTSVLVGEILGGGNTLEGVGAAWESSPGHRRVVLNPRWTHCGAATVRSATTGIWVVLFASHRVYPLEILRNPGGYLIRGRIAAAGAREPVLISGIEAVEALQWDAGRREFSFLVPLERGTIYHRLGYRSVEGSLVVTNTFVPLQAASSSGSITSDREMESP